MTTSTTKGLQLPCPKCGEPDANVMLSLADPTYFHCAECEEYFERTELDTFIARWTRVLSWIDAMPESDGAA